MKHHIHTLLVHHSSNVYIQFFRYGLVSVVALAVDFGGLVALKEYLGLHYLVAASLSFLGGLLVNYLLSAYWVFHGSKIDKRHHEFIVFAIIGLVGLGMTDGILWLLTSVLGLYYVLSKAIATVVVYFWNFGARKRFIFG